MRTTIRVSLLLVLIFLASGTTPIHATPINLQEWMDGSQSRTQLREYYTSFPPEFVATAPSAFSQRRRRSHDPIDIQTNINPFSGTDSLSGLGTRTVSGRWDLRLGRLEGSNQPYMPPSPPLNLSMRRSPLGDPQPALISTPEPGTILLLGLGLAGIITLGRYKNRKT